jgi:hypothetical protein
MLNTARTLPTALLALSVLTGCQHAGPVAYQPPIRIDALSAGLDAPDNAYRLLTAEQTEGRFACGLAIARLGLRQEGPDGPPQVVTMQPREQAFWGETFLGVRTIRDLSFLSPISLRPEQEGIAGLCVAARRSGATLLLVHWPNVLGTNSSEVLGVLYDVGTHTPLATLHASARCTNSDGVEESPDDEIGDHREADAGFQAVRAFQQRTRTCLIELAELDAPVPTPQPHEWDTERDLRWWLPTTIKIN